MTAAEANALGLAVAPQREFLNGAPIHNWYDDVLANEAGAWSKANQFTGPNSQATPEKIAAWNKFVADKIAASQAAANPGGVAPAPGAPPAGRRFDDGTYENGVFVPGGASSAPNTFLPPYLQPGAGATQGQPETMLARGAPPGSWDTITNGVSDIPGRITLTNPATGGAPAGITPPRSPLTPFTPGLSPMAGMPARGGGGSFGATAKLLELPWYLRNFRRQTYGRR